MGGLKRASQAESLPVNTLQFSPGWFGHSADMSRAVFNANQNCAAHRIADTRHSDERLLYCGMTRATVRLELLVQADNPANRRFLEN